MRRFMLTALGLILLALLAYGAFRVWGQEPEPGNTPALTYSLVRPVHDAISATVNASGSMLPARVVELNFEGAGMVTDVLVDVGNPVRSGSVLARLDPRDARLGVEQARASLAQATASYELLLADAPPEEVEQAQAQLEQAQAQYRQIEGEVTSQDIAAARSEVEAAQAELARLQAGPKESDIQAVQASLDRAHTNLQSQRDSLSAAKTQAHLQMEQAANRLRDQQASYSKLYWENRQAEEEWGSASINLAQDAKDREESMLRTVENAEHELELARTAYEQAQQAEVTGVQSAEAEVRSAQANLDQVLTSIDPHEITAAQSQVAQAQARLSRLLGEQRAGSLDAAAAGIEIARTRLESLTTPPREVDLASALAQVQQAQASLKQAELTLQQASLRSPIDGTVAEVNLVVGERVPLSGGQPAIVVADLTRFYVYGNVDEIDVAQLATGQPVRLTLDALPELSLEGTIDTISPLADAESSVATYEVRIETTTDDRRVRAGMSVNADIVVEQKENALLVPRRAVYAEGGRRFVDVLEDQTLCDADQSTWPPSPGVHALEVTTGLSNDQVIEITSETLTRDTCLYVEGTEARIDIFSGPPGGGRRRE
ncbi:MAG: efflux RND transporter periplasmic adaptor subunit [Chloroflexaceae bacterium]|nr:efflux RND transporter periplasmic adaptor subunit [Chloroflexaceae bacterium]